MLFRRVTIPKVNDHTPNRQEVLNEIAGVVTKKFTVPTEPSYWHPVNEILRASEIELDELTSEISWETLAQMRFFDEDGDYFQPLLLIHPNRRPSDIVVDKRPNFVRLWLYYYFPGVIIQQGAITIDVKSITELEALILEIKNSAIIEQVDAILTKAKVKTG